jgi:hypothetical protein
MIAHARAKAGYSAKTASIGMFAAFAMIIGLAFWTAAAWLLLLTLTTALNASLIIGAFYTGAGLLGFGIVAVRTQKSVAPPAPVKAPEATLESLISAFITGLNAGARKRS